MAGGGGNALFHLVSIESRFCPASLEVAVRFTGCTAFFQLSLYTPGIYAAPLVWGSLIALRARFGHCSFRTDLPPRRLVQGNKKYTPLQS